MRNYLETIFNLATIYLNSLAYMKSKKQNVKELYNVN